MAITLTLKPVYSVNEIKGGRDLEVKVLQQLVSAAPDFSMMST
jgi:hypothetical protein